MKVGDKYIIEISERYETIEGWDVPNEEQNNAPYMLYRIKGFNSLVFDVDGLSKLEKYEEQEKYDAEAEYQRGLDNAWEAARKLSIHPSMGGLDDKAYKSMFGDKFRMADQVLNNLTASEAIDKIKAYEEQKNAEDEIKVGDEVIPVADVEVLNPSKGVVVCEIAIGKNLRVMWDDGSSGCWEKDRLQKTGKHFDCIAEVLKQLKEGE